LRFDGVWAFWPTVLVVKSEEEEEVDDGTTADGLLQPYNDQDGRRVTIINYKGLRGTCAFPKHEYKMSMDNQGENEKCAEESIETPSEGRDGQESGEKAEIR
jgi:hypothetical protein